MLHAEDLSSTQRELEAQRIEREWHLVRTPDTLRPKRQRRLIVSTTYNPEPIEWSSWA